MRVVNSSGWVWLVSVCAAALVLSPAAGPRAQAFGGLWAAPGETVEQTALQVILIDDPGPTVTAVVRVDHAGSARELAWLIPVPGVPVVGVSSRVVFERLDAATAPEHWLELSVAQRCMDDAGASDLVGDPYAPPGGQGAPDEPVVALDRGSVGPYDYATITVDPTLDDPVAAASEWLTENGFALTGAEIELLGPYLREGLNVLAWKLADTADAAETAAAAFRPVTITYEGEQPLIPLRAAAASARADMDLVVWVLGPSQAVPTSFPSLVLNDALVDWLSGRKLVARTLPAGGDGPLAPYLHTPRNYDAVVSAAADEAGGRGFVTERAGPASQVRNHIWSALDDETFTLLAEQEHDDGLDVVLAARALYAGWDGFVGAVAGATTLPEDVTLSELLADPEAYRGRAEVDAATLLERLDEQVLRPVRDTASLLQRAPYLTRLHTRLSADEMTVDPVFDYNGDLALVGGVHVARQRIECSGEVQLAQAAWRIDLPQGGAVEGAGQDEWPLAIGSMPANLMVVALDAHGSGTLVEDNREAIGSALEELAGAADSGLLAPLSPEHGLTIGGSQRVVAPPIWTEPGPEPPAAQTGEGCHVARVAVGVGGFRSAWAVCWLLAATFLALRRRRGARRMVLAAGLCTLAACSSDAGDPAQVDGGAVFPEGALSREQLRDPETCKECHPSHYREWSASMHAYSAQDPVFLAMNRRGQRETDGELGDFCIKCHAPMAVVDGLTADGLDLEQLPDLERGVSCYFCHNVVAVEGEHNAMLRLAGDDVMRGPIREPLQPGVHRAEFSELFDQTNPEASAMCGACHDIVTPNGVHLERTFAEYRHGIYSKSAMGEAEPFDSCAGCHMPPRQGFAAELPGAPGPKRTVHEHLWPGIDVAITDFPHREAMRSAVEDCQLQLGISFFTLEVTPPDLFTFQLETNAGHNTPSGAAQDRRLWLEVAAYDASGALRQDVSSGVIADGELEEHPEGDPRHDPRLAMFRDRIYDADGKPAHMFWDAAKSDAYPDGYTSSALPVATTTYVEGRHVVLKQYRLSGPDGLPARVTAKLRLRPIGMDVLQDLVDSGDLDPAIAAEMPTFTFGTQIEWTPDAGVQQTLRAESSPADCTSYRCLLDPGSDDCR